VTWKTVSRPGYFGKRRDQIHMQLDIAHGAGNWRLVWIIPGFNSGADLVLDFAQACKAFYEESYFQHLRNRPDDIDFICEFAECMDNSPTNVQSGLDYTMQEASSTHIQDIAVRNVLHRLGRSFTGARTELLVIRSADSAGFRFNPGNVPFYNPALIIKPEIKPSWAQSNSVEAFWQSNKTLQVRAT
jgi:hypothetical protein